METTATNDQGSLLGFAIKTQHKKDEDQRLSSTSEHTRARNPGSLTSNVIVFNKILETLLPEGMIIPSAFETLEVLAGNHSLVTTVVENGLRFRVDLEKVYWNSRLGTERQRLLSGFNRNDVICDVFSGVGPIAISAAKIVKRVYANDLNPFAFEYLERNSVLNKLERKIKGLNIEELNEELMIFGRKVQILGKVYHAHSMCTDALFKEETSNALSVPMHRGIVGMPRVEGLPMFYETYGQFYMSFETYGQYTYVLRNIWSVYLGSSGPMDSCRGYRNEKKSIEQCGARHVSSPYRMPDQKRVNVLKSQCDTLDSDPGRIRVGGVTRTVSDRVLTGCGCFTWELVRACSCNGEKAHSITHVVMNLPNDAAEFLDAFRGVYRDQPRDKELNFPTIHVYGFSKARDPEFDFHERIRIALQEVAVNVDMRRHYNSWVPVLDGSD
ncbi:tRNA (guanine(37)-N1)-methyltransferase 1 [Hibiscus syriacus]|uniref:tRNA (Guanine(37)-N1)-methyltransferase 1 n=1 Tax=Hibiscus syriacus TaxID=106335 RepID=A0A6A2YNW6_HIBSY|nr:tRNA (guanine(37)-N1)-methyltransferase 1 [Hibiscus syriacus]